MEAVADCSQAVCSPGETYFRSNPCVQIFLGGSSPCESEKEGKGHTRCVSVSLRRNQSWQRCTREERIFIEVMSSDRKLKASRESAKMQELRDLKDWTMHDVLSRHLVSGCGVYGVWFGALGSSYIVEGFGTDSTPQKAWLRILLSSEGRIL